MTEANDAGTTGEHLVAAAKEGGNAVTHAVGRFADVVSSAVRRSGGNGAAQAAADGGARAADGVSRDATNLVRQAAEATGETQRELARRSAEGMAELGKLYAELLDEQGAFGRPSRSEPHRKASGGTSLVPVRSQPAVRAEATATG